MEGLRDPTKHFALRVIRMCASLPKNMAAQTMGRYVLRSGASVAANFREVSRTRSDAEFAAKLGIVEQELDETMLWFGLLAESGTVSEAKLDPLHGEPDGLIKIIVASIQRTRASS